MSDIKNLVTAFVNLYLQIDDEISEIVNTDLDYDQVEDLITNMAGRLVSLRSMAIVLDEFDVLDDALDLYCVANEECGCNCYLEVEYLD